MGNNKNLITLLTEKCRYWDISPIQLGRGCSKSIELINDVIKDIIVRVVITPEEDSERTEVYLKCSYLNKFYFEDEKEFDTNEELLNYLRQLNKIPHEEVEDINKEVQELLTHRLQKIIK